MTTALLGLQSLRTPRFGTYEDLTPRLARQLLRHTQFNHTAWLLWLCHVETIRVRGDRL